MMQEWNYEIISMDGNAPDVNRLFAIQANLEEDFLEGDMAEDILECRDALLEHCEIQAKYAHFPIFSQEAGAVRFGPQGEHCLTGTLLPKIIKDCDELILYVLTVQRFDQVMETFADDVVLSYFADAWGSAFAEAADNQLTRKLAGTLGKEQRYPTISHGPGEHVFPLINQKLIFQLLQPEDLGLTLTERCLMQPAKSLSGVIGIASTPQDLSKSSCDFCSMNQTCPTAFAYQRI